MKCHYLIDLRQIASLSLVTLLSDAVMDACSNEKTPGLVFITQTGSGKPRDVQTQIRKHVMKDIGKSRRKQGRRGRFPTWEISIDSPGSMDSMDSRSLTLGTTETDPNGEYGLDADALGSGITPVRYQQSDDGKFQLALPMYLVPKKPTTKLQHGLHQMQPQPSTMSGVAVTLDRLWTGRMDPFVRYPIEMNQRTLRLIDHGNHLFICFTLYALTMSRSL